jgi:hypothetical protein
MGSFASGLAFAGLLVLVAVVAASPVHDPVVMLAPGYLSKATTLGKNAMVSTLNAYTHPAQLSAPIPSAPHCLIGHDVIATESFGFDAISVTPVNASTVSVTITGLAPLKTTTVAFDVNCSFDGAFASPLQLPQKGTVGFNVIFAPQLSYLVTVVPTGGHNVTLAEPDLTTSVDAIATYAYEADGFAMDLFVASYFKATLATIIRDEVTAMIAAPSNFANAWFTPAMDSLSVFQFVCGTGMIPQYSALSLHLEPGCAPNGNVTATEVLLTTHDLLLVLPSSSGNAASTTTVSSFAQHVEAQRGNAVASTNGDLPPTCSGGMPCPPMMTVAGGMTLNFTNCVMCYPDGGFYTELAMTVTIAMP